MQAEKPVLLCINQTLSGFSGLRSCLIFQKYKVHYFVSHKPSFVRLTKMGFYVVSAAWVVILLGFKEEFCLW